MKRVDYSLFVEKKCSKCHVAKPVADFNKSTDPSAPITGWRYYSRCRDCSKEQSRSYGIENRPRRNVRLRQWRENNPNAARALDKRSRLQRKYKLTEEQRQAIAKRQWYRCAVCRKEVPLLIDHDHTTGRIRGLVCYRCNIGIGWFEAFEGDEEFRHRMREYLSRSPSDPAMLMYI